MEAAGSSVGSFLNDSLNAITPGSGNTWTAQYINPVTGASVSITDMSISANTVRIFVGARNLGAGVLGSAGPGGINAFGSSSFLSDALHRGEDASGATSSTLRPARISDPGVALPRSATGDNLVLRPHGIECGSLGQFRFLTVAVHEIFHVLGFWHRTPSWKHLLTISAQVHRTGQRCRKRGSRSITPDLAHWVDGKNHFLPGTAILQQTAMDPSIGSATRKLPTVLDWAGLDNTGWDVAASRLTFVPEPMELALFWRGWSDGVCSPAPAREG